jgi:methylmalonyl-CoA mutase
MVNESYQPHGNMLKGTTSSIAAVCGGCNSLTVYCEDESNTMMQRMARNTAVILKEESYLSKVADPLAGSYALEAMINDLAKESWKRFQSKV